MFQCFVRFYQIVFLMAVPFGLHGNRQSSVLTVELDAAISVPQRVLGDALVRSEVCWTDGTDRQFHVYFVGVV